MTDVFISYVEEDGRIADQIAQGLQVAGYSTWHYERDGLPGTDYLETIGATIDAVKAVVIVISAKSLQSQQVYRELVRAAENNKALFPLLYGIRHEQFQERGQKWRQALGATTSIAIPPDGVAVIMPRLLAGLMARGISPTGGGGNPQPQQPPPPPPRPKHSVPILVYAALLVLAIAVTVAITLAVTRRGISPSAPTATVSQEQMATAAARETPAPTAAPLSAAAPTTAPTLPAAPALDVHATLLQLLEVKYPKQIAWSADGKWIAIRSYDIPFLDARTTKEMYRITSVQWPSSLAFSPDGKTLAYAGDQVTFVQVGTWGELGTLAGSGGTKALAYSPDGRRLATAIGNVVKLWNLSSGKEEWTFPDTSGFALAFSPDGKMVAAAGGTGGGEIKRWNAEMGEELPVLKGHTNWIKTLEFSPNGRVLASGSVDQSIRLWDAATGRLLMVLNGHTGEVTDLSFSPDGRLLASASWDLTVKLWDLATGQELQSLLGHTGRIEAVAFSPDGRLLASGADDGVRLWSIELGSAANPTTASPAKPVPTSAAANAISPQNAAGLKSWKTLNSAGHQVTWSPDGKWLGVAGSKPSLYDAASLEQMRAFTTLLDPQELAFSPDGKTLAALRAGVKLFSTNSGAELYTLFSSGSISSAVCSSFLAYSPDGATLAVVEGDTVKLFDGASGQEKNTLVVKGAFAIAFAADGRHIFASNWEDGISLLDVASGEVARTFGEASKGTECLVLSPGGDMLASAGISGDEVILWDAASGRQLRTLPGHKQGVLRLAFSPDGRILASSGRDVTIRLWDVATGDQLCSLVGHAESPESLAFSPDGVTLASAGHDNDVHLWRIAP